MGFPMYGKTVRRCVSQRMRITGLGSLSPASFFDLGKVTHRLIDEAVGRLLLVIAAGRAMLFDRREATVVSVTVQHIRLALSEDDLLIDDNFLHVAQ